MKNKENNKNNKNIISEQDLLNAFSYKNKTNDNISVLEKIKSKDFTESVMNRIYNDNENNNDNSNVIGLNNSFLDSKDKANINYIYNSENRNNDSKIINIFNRNKNVEIDDVTSDIDNNELDNIDNVLSNLKNFKGVNVGSNFTSNVMDRISNYQPTVYNERNIEEVLKGLKTKQPIKPSINFTKNVMNRIENSYLTEDSKYNNIFKKFLIGSVVVAAASIILTLSFFSDFNADTAEFMAVDYFDTGLY